MDVTVLYEDEHLIAVDKPAGMVVHPAYKNPAGTLLDALTARVDGWRATERPSIVGRLDKLTSGLVLIAKTAAAHAALQRTMASAQAEKDYLALVYGRIDADAGVIELPLALDPADRRVVVVSPALGAACTTRFEVVGRADAEAVGLTLLRCRLVTGRRHQIRVHLAASGWPIVGDPAYGQPRWMHVIDPGLASALRSFPRQALHAEHVGFIHPVMRERIDITAPLPSDMEALLRAAGFDVP